MDFPANNWLCIAALDSLSNHFAIPFGLNLFSILPATSDKWTSSPVPYTYKLHMMAKI